MNDCAESQSGAVGRQRGVFMLLRQLEYFVAVARERHFARAAEACYVSQPALSASIAKLEKELNVTLINRGRSFEGLTPEGERLVVWAKRILAEQEAFKAEVAAVQSGITGTLRLGTEPTASPPNELTEPPFSSGAPVGQGADRLPVVDDGTVASAARIRTGRSDRSFLCRGSSRLAGRSAVRGAVHRAGIRPPAAAQGPHHDVGGRRTVAACAADTRHENSPGHRQGVRRMRGGGYPTGGDRLGRFALRPGRRRGVGEHRAAHMVARTTGGRPGESCPTD